MSKAFNNELMRLKHLDSKIPQNIDMIMMKSGKGNGFLTQCHSSALSHLWLSAFTRSASPSCFSELLLDKQHSYLVATALNLTVYSLCDSFPLQRVWTLQPHIKDCREDEGPLAMSRHWKKKKKKNSANLPCLAVKLIIQTLLPLFWLVIVLVKCACHLLLLDYLESGVTLHGTRLSVTTAASHLLSETAETDKVWAVWTGPALHSPNHCPHQDIWSSSGQQLHCVLNTATPLGLTACPECVKEAFSFFN